MYRFIALVLILTAQLALADDATPVVVSARKNHVSTGPQSIVSLAASAEYERQYMAVLTRDGREIPAHGTDTFRGRGRGVGQPSRAFRPPRSSHSAGFAQLRYTR